MSDSVTTRVGHCKADETDVYVGRGPGGRDMLSTPVGKRGWLGNPHSVDDYGREGSIKRFRKAFEHRLENDDTFRNAVRQLAGKRLGCWCQRLNDDGPACHAEVIAEHADRLAEEQPAVTDGGSASDLRRRDRIEVERDGETVTVFNWVTMERATRIRGNNPVVENFEPTIYAGDSNMMPEAVTDWVAGELAAEFNVHVSDLGIEVVNIEHNLDKVVY